MCKLCYCLFNNEVNFVYSKFLYPKRDFANDAMSDDGDSLQSGNPDGKYELFAEVDNTVRDEIKDLVFNGESVDMITTLAVCICYENQLCCSWMFTRC